jgi:hypothetical protein
MSEASPRWRPQVISLVVFVGYSVTYALHIAHNYNQAALDNGFGEMVPGCVLWKWLQSHFFLCFGVSTAKMFQMFVSTSAFAVFAEMGR